MKGVIIYQSKYGSTKRYSEWLSEETGFDCIETRKARIEDIKQYDIVILGGGVYASGIAGLSFLKKYKHQLSGKKIIVFCVGASPYDENAFKQIVAHNMKDSLVGIPCFYCRGAWDMDNMNVVDRNLCKLLRKAVAKKDPNKYEIWEKALVSAGDEKCDWTDKSYIVPILEAIK